MAPRDQAGRHTRGVAIDPHADNLRRTTRATLWAGFFTNGVWDMLSVVVPLYGAAVGLSAAEIGLIVAARSVLPTALSIHGGILMDHWGTRRVILWLAVACTLLPPLYPATGWFTVLALLQLILGLASSLSMAAAQTWSLQTSFDTATLARFSLVSRIGTFIAPVMIGAIWDLLGAWAAFASISLWAAGTIAAAVYGSAPVEAARPHPQSSAWVLVPRWEPHKRAIALAAIPAVAFVLAVSFLRNAPGAIQSSFYIVYLGDVGLSGTMIGALIGASELSGVFGSLAAAPAERVMRAHRLILLCIAASVTAIAITPLIAYAVPLLFAAAAVRGMGQGLSQPLTYAVLGRAVPSNAHGASVGLRNSVTRLASIVTPTVMGIAAEGWGIEASFYIAGAALLAATLVLAIAARSTPN